MTKKQFQEMSDALDEIECQERVKMNPKWVRPDNSAPISTPLATIGDFFPSLNNNPQQTNDL